MGKGGEEGSCEKCRVGKGCSPCGPCMVVTVATVVTFIITITSLPLRKRTLGEQPPERQNGQRLCVKGLLCTYVLRGAWLPRPVLPPAAPAQ